MTDKKHVYAIDLAQQQLAQLNSELLLRKLRITQSPCDTNVHVEQKSLRAFCSNDYLGLANHPVLVEALREGVVKYGVGSGASHLISGHSIAHDLLEKKLAQFQDQHIPDVKALFF